MTEPNEGPLYKILHEYDDGTCRMEFLTGFSKGQQMVAVAEFVRLANADELRGERSRASGDYS